MWPGRKAETHSSAVLGAPVVVVVWWEGMINEVSRRKGTRD